ncbi:hypothetical protein pb186bvf_008266 [Paramecium bursaria]
MLLQKNLVRLPSKNGNISINFVCVLSTGDLEFTSTVLSNMPFKQLFQFAQNQVLGHLSQNYNIQAYVKNILIDSNDERPLAELGINNGDQVRLNVDLKE